MAIAMTMHWQNGFFMNRSGAQKGEGIEYNLLAAGLASVEGLVGARFGNRKEGRSARNGPRRSRLQNASDK